MVGLTGRRRNVVLQHQAECDDHLSCVIISYKKAETTQVHVPNYYRFSPLRLLFENHFSPIIEDNSQAGQVGVNMTTRDQNLDLAISFTKRAKTEGEGTPPEAHLRM